MTGDASAGAHGPGGPAGGYGAASGEAGRHVGPSGGTSPVGGTGPVGGTAAGGPVERRRPRGHPSLGAPGAGLAGAVLALLAGGWLMLSPFALGYQAAGVAWSNTTRTNFFTGVGLAALAVLGIATLTADLRSRLRGHGASRTDQPDPDRSPAERPTPAPDELTAAVRALAESLDRLAASQRATLSGPRQTPGAAAHSGYRPPQAPGSVGAPWEPASPPHGSADRPPEPADPAATRPAPPRHATSDELTTLLRPMAESLGHDIRRPQPPAAGGAPKPSPDNDPARDPFDQEADAADRPSDGTGQGGQS